MELNLDFVGQEITPRPFEYDWKTCALYALGIGADTSALDYTWEGVPAFKVVPSFAVIPTQPIVMKALAKVNADFRRLVHGAQTITMHQPIPVEGTLQSTGRITEVQDKGKGAVVIIETQTTDSEGTALFDTSWSIFCRGQGDFGGERGESVPIPEIQEGADPVFEKSYETSSSQALLYRLSGDLNPLHVDPELATKAGFPAPILHGLCSYGYAARAAIDSVCGGDPARLKSFTARFSQVVYPGDALTVSIVPAVENNTYRLQVDAGDIAFRGNFASGLRAELTNPRTVLSHGVIEVR